MLVKVAHYTSSTVFFGQIMLKLCSFLQIMVIFFLIGSSKTIAKKSKNTFSLIRSRLFLLAIIHILSRVRNLFILRTSFNNDLLEKTPTDMVCHGTSGSRTPWSQIPLKHRTTSEYNWDLEINVTLKTQKCSDNYQNMRIMIAVLRFKKREKLC